MARLSIRTLSLVPLMAALFGGCANSGLTSEGDAAPPSGIFDRAEAETGVPALLLMAISQAETRMQMVDGNQEFEGQVTGHGVMAMRGENITEGAYLAGYEAADVNVDRDANVLASAYLMATWAEEEGINTNNLEAWANVVARYSGISNPEAAAEYVHNEVYHILNQGFEMEGLRVAPDGLIIPEFPLPQTSVERHGSTPATGGLVWSGSPNYNSRNGADVDFLVIHTCEGSYSGCWGYLTSSSAGVSAHYVVNDKGTEVRQLVNESDRAWHIGASYECNNNSGLDCWRNGNSMNTMSVGIEHAGYASQSSWDPGLIARSAQLACDITNRQNIPRDSYHIVGHGQMQPYNRTDPGANWPWSDYMNQIQVACGDVAAGSTGGGSTGGGSTGGGSTGGGSTGGGSTGGGSTAAGVPLIIDSNNGANDMNKGYTEAGSGWWGSANVSGYYNTGYFVAETEPVSDPTNFWFYSDTARCFKVEAWWSSAWDRPPNVTFLGKNASGAEVGRKGVNQRGDGGQWNHLGDWNYEAGWNTVALSRWATAGSYVVADAVRVTPDACTP